MHSDLSTEIKEKTRMRLTQIKPRNPWREKGTNRKDNKKLWATVSKSGSWRDREDIYAGFDEILCVDFKTAHLAQAQNEIHTPAAVYTSRFLQPATWISYYAVLLWLLQVTVTLTVL